MDLPPPFPPVNWRAILTPSLRDFAFRIHRLRAFLAVLSFDMPDEVHRILDGGTLEDLTEFMSSVQIHNQVDGKSQGEDK